MNPPLGRHRAATASPAARLPACRRLEARPGSQSPSRRTGVGYARPLLEWWQARQDGLKRIGPAWAQGWCMGGPATPAPPRRRPWNGRRRQRRARVAGQRSGGARTCGGHAARGQMGRARMVPGGIDGVRPAASKGTGGGVLFGGGRGRGPDSLRRAAGRDGAGPTATAPAVRPQRGAPLREGRGQGALQLWRGRIGVGQTERGRCRGTAGSKANQGRSEAGKGRERGRGAFSACAGATGAPRAAGARQGAGRRARGRGRPRCGSEERARRGLGTSQGGRARGQGGGGAANGSITHRRRAAPMGARAALSHRLVTCAPAPA
jgi:hypothetical protein